MNGSQSNIAAEQGFTLAEFLLSTLILLVMSGYMFTVMADMERSAGYQTQIQGVLANTRIAMNTVQRYLKHAGNNPHEIALQGLTIVSPSEARIQADLTGSSTTDPNRGDPDGDINDLDEDVTLRHNAVARTIELVLPDGTVRTVASFINQFSMQYLDQFGGATAVGSDVQRVQVTISGRAATADLRTGQTFGVTNTSDVYLVSR